MAKYTLLKNKETGERSVRVSGTGEVVKERDNPTRYADLRKKALKSLERAQKKDLMESMGLTRVRGSVSGKIYWE
jgi:hypothetical protein